MDVLLRVPREQVNTAVLICVGSGSVLVRKYVSNRLVEQGVQNEESITISLPHAEAIVFEFFYK